MYQSRRDRNDETPQHNYTLEGETSNLHMGYDETRKLVALHHLPSGGPSHRIHLSDIKALITFLEGVLNDNKSS